MRKILLLLFAAPFAWADGTLTDDIRISSEVLNYDLQYRVYLPEAVDTSSDLPVMFVTDGPGFIGRGRMPSLLDRLIGDEQIDPVVVVFVDARDPDQPGRNRRNQQFLCNERYYEFYKLELIPAIEAAYPVAQDAHARSIAGLSFGATNAACFALRGADTFYRNRHVVTGQPSTAEPAADVRDRYRRFP